MWQIWAFFWLRHGISVGPWGTLVLSRSSSRTLSCIWDNRRLSVSDLLLVCLVFSGDLCLLFSLQVFGWGDLACSSIEYLGFYISLLFLCTAVLYFCIIGVFVWLLFMFVCCCVGCLVPFVPLINSYLYFGHRCLVC